MSAPDIEGLTDVIVEHTPGDRLLAERIAGAVWRAEAEVKAEALREAVEMFSGPDVAIELALSGPSYIVHTLRDRADALSASTGGGRLPGRDQAADAAQGQPAGSEGQVRDIGDGTRDGEDHE